MLACLVGDKKFHEQVSEYSELVHQELFLTMKHFKREVSECVRNMQKIRSLGY